MTAVSGAVKHPRRNAMTKTRPNAGFDYTQVSAKQATALRRGADELRDLDWAAGKSVLEMGRLLAILRENFPPKQAPAGKESWGVWLENELGWSKRYALSLIQVYKKLHARPGAHLISFKVLQYLVRNTTPEALTDEVLGRAEQGEVMGRGAVEKLRQEKYRREPPLPSKEKANVIARETGKAVAASDGRIYSGRSDAEADAYQDRRNQVYTIIDAIGQLYGVAATMSAADWLESAEAWWLTDLGEFDLEQTINWLTALRSERANG